uniref:Uncharacterized protein n=1 Tax=Oryza meridionalis TaxID=40149 RepID=A0A0E0DE91_9ORYZ
MPVRRRHASAAPLQLCTALPLEETKRGVCDGNPEGSGGEGTAERATGGGVLGRVASRRDQATKESRERRGWDCGEGDQRVGDSRVA